MIHSTGHPDGRLLVNASRALRLPVRKPNYLPDRQRVMWAASEYFHGLAVWTRKQGIWICAHTAPALHWMRSLKHTTAQLELLKRGFDWHWIS